LVIFWLYFGYILVIFWLVTWNLFGDLESKAEPRRCHSVNSREGLRV
jgi:hypothetical protein